VIISRTPVRVSLFGGGTDYPIWFHENIGSVLSMAIDKYVYISCRYLPPFFDYRSRIVYSKIELVNGPDDIEHPAVREGLKYLNVQDGVAIQHESDIPARTGVGSSSSFAVGLLHALYTLRGHQPTKMRLALDAIHLEQDLLHENVGVQDQLAAAFGGFNRMNFYPDGTLEVLPVILPAARLRELLDHLVLVFTGFQRNASEIAARQIATTPSRTTELTAMRDLVDEAQRSLCSDEPIDRIGSLLDEAWHLKRSLSDSISNPTIDGLYEAARDAGALGGKLLGAGGGGFALLFVPPSRRKRVLERLSGLTYVPFRLDRGGSQIVHYLPEEYTNFEYPEPAVALAGPGQHRNGHALRNGNGKKRESMAFAEAHR